MTMAPQTTKKRTPPRILIHGEGGTGKSTIGACAPNSIFINTEGGLDEIEAQDFGQAKTFDDVINQASWIYQQEHDFKTCVVDTLDWAEKLAGEKVCEDGKKNALSDFAYGKGYDGMLSQMKRLQNALQGIYEERNMAIIILAHSRIKTFQDPLGENYDRYQVKTRDTVSELFFEWCDLVGFLSPQVLVIADDGGIKQSKKAIGSDIILRCQRGNPAYIGKNRYRIKDDIVISEENGWNDIITAIGEANGKS